MFIWSYTHILLTGIAHTQFVGHVANVLLKERTAVTGVRLVADEIIILGFTEH